MPLSTPKSMISPILLMPSPKVISNSHLRNGGATLFLPFPTPGDVPDPGTQFVSPTFPALAGGFVTTEPPGKHKK